jgi:hypothetical protein
MAMRVTLWSGIVNYITRIIEITKTTNLRNFGTKEQLEYPRTGFRLKAGMTARFVIPALSRDPGAGEINLAVDPASLTPRFKPWYYGAVAPG